MHLTNLLLMASSAVAISLPNLPDISTLFARNNNLARKDGGSSGSCPAVWTQISKDLTAKFLSDGQCNPDARAAIRAVFHDCGGSCQCLRFQIFLANRLQHGTKPKVQKAAVTAPLFSPVSSGSQRTKASMASLDTSRAWQTTTKSAWRT